MCGPPTFEYGAPCDQTLGDGSPVCDCSAGAEYTSGSLVSRRKVVGASAWLPRHHETAKFSMRTLDHK